MFCVVGFWDRQVDELMTGIGRWRWCTVGAAEHPYSCPAAVSHRFVAARADGRRRRRL